MEFYTVHPEGIWSEALVDMFSFEAVLVDDILYAALRKDDKRILLTSMVS